MFFYLIFFVLLIITILLLVFFTASFSMKWDRLMASSFECGFSSYFFSRSSFSIHYFLIGLIFLFLDLELCFIMPYFNESCADFIILLNLNKILFLLLLGLLIEWGEGKLNWKY